MLTAAICYALFTDSDLIPFSYSTYGDIASMIATRFGFSVRSLTVVAELIAARYMIRMLLRHGAINERKDPNGLVPSNIQMKLFACNWTDYQECRRYYREGPRDRSSVWPGPVPMSPDDMYMANPRSQIPHEDAVAEYHRAMGLVSEDTLEGTGSSGDEESSLHYW
jgi:hypothetical protein